MTDAKSAPSADTLLDAVLVHVPFEGMNHRALVAGARDLGVAMRLAEALLPGGAAGLAAAYHRRGDAELRASLAAEPPQGRFRDRIAEAVMRRLALADAEVVRAGAAVMALPPNLALGPRLMGETAHVIWNALGDTSDDVAWWTKRLSLGAVIGATVLYWLGDRTADQSATREFLDRRIGEVMGFETLKARVRRVPGVAAMAQAATGWIRAPHREGGKP
ncbi:COQ9 family protein [Paracoccus suum]|uniref:COQ9 family protein n=1 Tax=Paracoccus suum TaxID=2259340 RepID=A0A344PGR3_9RHOB|nr:COQ9 family protein [Paracoccus suum]AXC48568.1 COQ9 family protein [Paracoccus suum]